MSVIAIGQQGMSQIINVIHNTYLPKILESKAFRIKAFSFLIFLVVIFSAVFYFSHSVIIELFLDSSFDFVWYVFFGALVYELSNYLLAVFTLIIPKINSLYYYALSLSFCLILICAILLSRIVDIELLALGLLTCSPLVSLIFLFSLDYVNRKKID